jgi:dihydroorotate dehydrogenase
VYRYILRPFFFLVDPEKIHHFVFGSIKFLMRIPGFKSLFRALYAVKDKRLERTVFGITFPNPVGLAAGLDKDAKLFDELGILGFGFIEIGTLTPKPQPENEKPRMFRLREDSGLINRMGFNNEGVVAAAERLKHRKTKVIVGGNIGKNKVTPNEEAVKDYESCFETLFPYVDYFVVNVSSPNTPNLRELQDKAPLTELLNRVKALNAQKKNPKPVLLKIAPDLTDTQLDDIIEIVKSTKIDGVVATNTTISRDGLRTPSSRLQTIGMGGLSGKPLTKRATEVIRYLHTKSGGSFPIIGVGGIHSAEDALEKIEAGAVLVQLYTGFIYEGPKLITRINKLLLEQSVRKN